MCARGLPNPIGELRYVVAEQLVLHTRVVSGAGGGPEKTIINSPRFLVDKGYPMLCAYMRPPGDLQFQTLQQRAAEKQATIIPVDDNGAFDWRVISRMNELCREHRPAIWHGHDYKSNLLGLFSRRAVPMRLVTTVHGWVHRTWKTPLYYAIDKWCLRYYEHVICVSRDLYEAVRDMGVPDDRRTFIPNAIDIDEFVRSRTQCEARADAGHDAKKLVVGAVGRLSAEKGFHLLIEAFMRVVREQDINAELWIVGDGPERARLERLVESSGSGGYVRLQIGRAHV